jgi:hypothetical protein
MAQPRQQGRSDREARPTAPLGELHGLDHLRAPWFFETEIQRRLRIGDPGRPTRPKRGAWIGVIAFAIVAGLAVTAVFFEADLRV